MAEIAAALIGPVIEVVKWVAAPIQRQFNYLCCFTSNITSMKNECEKLQDETGDLRGKADIARDNVRVISSKVESWLKNSDDIKMEMDGIVKEVPKVESNCSNLIARYSLSKRAMKITDRSKVLRGQCNFNDDAISWPRPPAAREAIPLERTYEFESRKQIEEEIMATLRLGDVSMMGICGMGGLGKTTMAKIIINRALEEHVFKEVVMAVVSQTVDKLKIQDEIAGALNLKFEGETSQAAKAQKLRTRLSDDKKRILLVLDDVWERLVLEDLGIPRNYNGCTIFLTSRNSDVFVRMNVEKVFRMKMLSKEDAWFLFRQRAGACVDDIGLSSTAEEVVKECKGLPLALEAVGSALKDEKDVRIWKDALRRLRQSDIPGLLPDVYNPLKLSYDALDVHQKFIFFLCCLYPEDANIYIDDLTYFSMGLGKYEGITNVEDARNNILSLASKVKSRSLLLDSKDGEDYVRMHDIVRDVCIFIAKQEKYIGVNDCSWISSSHGIPSSLGFQNLRLIFWICDSANAEFKMDSSFLEGIRDLNVLYIRRGLFTLLPFATQSLKNLKTLIIASCENLKTLSSIGELVSLEILMCQSCSSINELPREMERLTRLKVLDLTGCRNLKRIGRGIISNLVWLEELKMLESFDKWETDDREVRENAGLKELEALTKLRWLDIKIENPALVVKNIQLSSRLDRFDIRLSPRLSGLDFHRFSKKLHLFLEGESCLSRWIEMQLLRHTECLHLVGDGANNVDLAKTENIRVLHLFNCASMKEMVRASSNGGVLPYMEYLCLFRLPELEKIWDGPIWLNLKHLELKDLPALKQLWKSRGIDSEKDYLPHLETLRIVRCEKMEQVFMWDKNENQSHQILHITKRFPKLKKVELDNLPNLTSFYHGIQGVEFPQLSELTVEGCGKLNWMFSEVNDNSVRDGSSGVDLEKDYLPHLETLRIARCEKMEQVFKWDKNEKESHHILHITKRFPKLKKVFLFILPNLTSLYHGIQGVEFPQLSYLYIQRCEKLNWMVSKVNDNNSVGDGSSSNAHIHHPLSQPQEVSLRCLKNLITDWAPFAGHIIHVSIFNGLEELQIDLYKGSMSLFSSSITGALVNLTTLSIGRSDEMVKAISDEEKVVSGGERATLFPKLLELELYKLPELVSFCEWKCDVELPSLRRVKISWCRNMKSFSLGPLTTPNLTSIEIHHEHFDAAKDLNDALNQWCWRKEQH